MTAWRDDVKPPITPRTPLGEQMPRADVRGGKRSDRETVVTLRLPRELHERLREVAGERGLTELIRERLQASLALDDAFDLPVFAQIMRTIRDVIVFCAEMYPDDIHKYSIMEFAVKQILEAYRPMESKDVDVRQTYVKADIQFVGKVERLVGIALGQIGAVGVTKSAELPILKIEPEDTDC
jgi:hypothetical protein